MDYRSFQLHYECAVLLYHMPAVEDLLEDMDHIMAQSQPYTLEEWNQRPWLRQDVRIHPASGGHLVLRAGAEAPRPFTSQEVPHVP